ncbi:CCA tRNA nucleotidyltransferase [Acetobacter persici]|uniref:CCA tRNA nucleotidyltransferase n=1 Tax=Acetobacter persici TaxID=1076596 RepID=UPI001BA88A01|nr:CCA tRNA nucleotidyltransferase [Acetobacter persici]MBS1000545.1 CCA tRNA nucleotidyltransferase [Acetobacter persici]
MTSGPQAAQTHLSPPQRHALGLLWQVLPEARLVGGVVRDLMMGRSVADVDLATPEPPEQVLATLKQAGIKAIPTGLAHGTVTAVIESAPYEITTLRRDVETDGRHAVVVWTADWREDAARRDFTMNAMSRGRDGVLHDYFGGQQDLAQGLVRFVGNAPTRIAEDALRILRFFRFQARYGRGQPDAEAIEAITTQAGLLRGLSVERIWSELKRILTGAAVPETLSLMEQTGVLAVLFPNGVTEARLTRMVVAGAPADAVLRLAGLVPEDKGDLARRLKLSKAEAAFLKGVSSPPVPQPHMTDADLRRLLALEPPEVLLGRTWLEQADRAEGEQVAGAKAAEKNASSADWLALRTRLSAMTPPVFPLAGRDVLAAGHPPGPQVGAVLEQVRAWWLAEGCTAPAEACLAFLKKVLKSQS